MKTEHKNISTEVRDESFTKVMDNGTVESQEDRALKLMYGENLTNHQLSKKLNIPITSATRVVCGMRDKEYLFNLEKVFNKKTDAQNTVFALTVLGKKRGQNLLWQDFYDGKMGSV